MAAVFKTIVTKYAATCNRCKEEVPAGTKVRWRKGGAIWHFAAECPASL